MVFHGEIAFIEELLVVWMKTVASMPLFARAKITVQAGGISAILPPRHWSSYLDA